MIDIERRYRDQYPTFSLFSKRLHELIETVLNSSAIKYHLVESRTKDIDSFLEKLTRKQEKYKNPIEEVTDICALRIITFYIEDLEKIDSLLRTNFYIDEANSFNAKQNLHENQFGYLSSHYVVSLKSDRSNLPEWSQFKDLKAEIQVRTVLQHAWAAISHELEYKKAYEIPSVLKRKLFRLAGLIELADEEFQIAREKHKLVEDAIKEKKSFNEIKIYEELNLNTIQNYFSQQATLLKEIEESGIQAGFEVDNEHVDLAEKQNKFYSEILKLCQYKNIVTIKDFDFFLKSLLSTSQTELNNIYRIDGKSWKVSGVFLVLLIVLVSLSKEQLKQYDHSSWGQSVWDSLVTYIEEK